MTTSRSDRFRERLRTSPPLLLDAAMGSDLNRRGLPTRLPLWSALGLLERPDLVREIHQDNLMAGADIITTNTFRTTGRTLAKVGIGPERAAELDALAVRLANDARAEAGRPEAFIAGSIAPLEDCYSPVFDIPAETALAEHRAQARNLTEAGVDLLMVETMPTSAEAAVALAAALEPGLPVTIGFVCETPEPGAPVRLLSGETLADAAGRVLVLGPAAILVNCAPSDVIAAGVGELLTLSDIPVGGYANAGHVDDEIGWSPAGGMSGDEYTAIMSRSGWRLGLVSSVVAAVRTPSTPPPHGARSIDWLHSELDLGRRSGWRANCSLASISAPTAPRGSCAPRTARCWPMRPSNMG